MRVERVAAALLLSISLSAGQAALYKWVDEKGRVQYSDKPPSDGDKGAVQMTNRGVVVKKIEPGMSAEQKKAQEDEQARRKQESLQAAEQRKKDNALLQSFTNVQEIDMKRDRELQALDTMIANLRGQERSISERITEDRRRMEFYAKRKKPPPESVQEDIERNEAQVKLLRDEIERHHHEVIATRSKYEALKKRYQELREEQSAGTGTPGAATTAAQTPSKKSP
jgi:chromosome segregation ATPase